VEAQQIEKIVEAALLAADGPLTVANLVKLFHEGELDEENASKQIRDAIKVLQEQSAERGVELHRVASGYRFQVRQELSQWVSRLWEEKPPRYTRALLETLALVAYKQPVTRGDIEQVRGVSVSQNIMRTLLERDWIKVVGQREVPGRPSLYATTKAFLDYFNLQSLEQLPPLAEIKAILEPAVAAVDDTPAPVDESGLQESGDVAEVTAVKGVHLPGDETDADELATEQAAEQADVEIAVGDSAADDTATDVAADAPLPEEASAADESTADAVDNAAESQPEPAAQVQDTAPSGDASEAAEEQVQESAQVVQLHAAQSPGGNS